MNTCIFCKIISGEHPAAVVFQTDATICFLDHRPLFPGHVLVVPRAHHETIEDLPQELLGPLFEVVQRASRAVRTTMEAAGSFVAANNKVSQSVPHLHIHVVPRSPGDGLRGFFWPRNPYDDDAHLEEVRHRVAEAFRSDG